MESVESAWLVMINGKDGEDCCVGGCVLNCIGDLSVGFLVGVEGAWRVTFGGIAKSIESNLQCLLVNEGDIRRRVGMR